MKKILGFVAIMLALNSSSFANDNGFSNHKIVVPVAVKQALIKRYPESRSFKITWEKEKGNYEANWGGNDGEANSVQFTPKGEFIEIVKAISSGELPKPVLTYVAKHYKTAKFGDVGKVKDARGKTSYEVEIHGKDVIFDENGNFVKEEK